MSQVDRLEEAKKRIWKSLWVVRGDTPLFNTETESLKFERKKSDEK
jgi:hypothetical protein